MVMVPLWIALLISLVCVALGYLAASHRSDGRETKLEMRNLELSERNRNLHVQLKDLRQQLETYDMNWRATYRDAKGRDD